MIVDALWVLSVLPWRALILMHPEFFARCFLYCCVGLWLAVALPQVFIEHHSYDR